MVSIAGNLDQRIRIMQWACLGMSLCSFALGGWMILQPNAFWSMIGAPVIGDGGMAVSSRVVYGGAICGEAVALMLIYLSPLRYLNFLHYMMAYKAAACVGLAAWLLNAQPFPTGGWMLVAGWASAGLIAAAIYPWGQQAGIVQRLHAQQMNSS